MTGSELGLQDLSATEEAQDGTSSVRSSPHPEAGRALRADPGLRATLPAPTYAHWGVKHKYRPTTVHSMLISEGSQSTATLLEADRCTPMACSVIDTVCISEARCTATENDTCATFSARTSTTTVFQSAHHAVMEDIDIAGSCGLGLAPVHTQDGSRPPAYPQKRARLSHVAGVEPDRRPKEIDSAAGLASGAQRGSLPVGPLPGIGLRTVGPCGATGSASELPIRGPAAASTTVIQALEAAGGGRTTAEGVREGDVRRGGEVEGAGGAALEGGRHPGEAAGHAEVARWCAEVAAGHADVAAGWAEVATGSSDRAGSASGWAAWAAIGEAHVCRRDLSSVARVMVSHLEASASHPPAVVNTGAGVSVPGSHLVPEAHCSTQVKQFAGKQAVLGEHNILLHACEVYDLSMAVPQRETRCDLVAAQWNAVYKGCHLVTVCSACS